jgi:hypothetical protein
VRIATRRRAAIRGASAEVRAKPGETKRRSARLGTQRKSAGNVVPEIHVSPNPAYTNPHIE